MIWDFLASKMPDGTVAAAIVSVVAAVATAVMGYRKSLLLERQKNGYQRDLENLRNVLQGKLENKKVELQKELEDHKAGIADEVAARNARRGYEYDARKRLYQEVEPLLFQLFEAAEDAFYAVASLARTERDGHLPEWLKLNQHPYYIRSIIHRLFRPLAIYRLLQRSTTLVDLTLDPTISLRYVLLKECYLTWTRDRRLASTPPKLPYDPDVGGWNQRGKSARAIHWRQGLLIGDLDRLVDSMAVSEGTKYRVMNFGEFDTAIVKDKKFRTTFGFATEIFQNFSFNDRPILGRLLIAYAAFMHILMIVYTKAKDDAAYIDLNAVLKEFITSEEAKRLNWHTGAAENDVVVVSPYLERRIEQMLRADLSNSRSPASVPR